MVRDYIVRVAHELAALMLKYEDRERHARAIIKRKEIRELLEAITGRCLDVASLAEGIWLQNT